jgi:hypothetical protein
MDGLEKQAREAFAGLRGHQYSRYGITALLGVLARVQSLECSAQYSRYENFTNLREPGISGVQINLRYKRVMRGK